MRGKIMILLSLLSLTALLFLSCKEDNSRIRLGLLPVIDTLPLIVADHEGLFKEKGINLELVYFNSALEKESAFASGSLDASFGDLIAAMLAVKSGVDARIVCESSHTEKKTRMFALLASPRSGIKTIRDTGKSEVAISMGTIIEFFLDEIMKSKNIPARSAKKIEVKAIPVRLQMLMSGSVKLALIPEPLASLAIQEGALLLADDTQLDTTATVIMFNGKFLADNPRAMNGFINAYNEAVKRININPEKYRSLLIEKAKIPEKVKETYPVPSYNSFRLPAEKDVMLVYDWMKARNMVSMPFNYRSLTWAPEKQ